MALHGFMAKAAVALTMFSSKCIASMIEIDATPQQTIKAFGASGAWWPNNLIEFPPEQREKLAEILFSPSGIHLSAYRYNMGANSVGVTSPGNVVESFLAPNGTYDWSRDYPGVYFLKLAQAYSVPYLTFFVNSAPSSISNTGQSCNWNLSASEIPAYSEYVQTVLSHWVGEGIDIKFVSTMNEPDSSFPSCNQEGMLVPVEIRPAVFKAMKHAMESNPLSAKVDLIGDETSQLSIQAIPEYPIWIPSSVEYLSNIAVHNYDYPNDTVMEQYYSELLRLTDYHPPPVKFTETCCSRNGATGVGNGPIFGTEYDPTIVNALIVARYAWQFLTIANAESFEWWSAIGFLPCSPTLDPGCQNRVNTTAGINSGLVSIDTNYNETGDYSLYLTKRAYAMKHFATFFRPGSVRHNVPFSSLPEGVVSLVAEGPSTGYEKPLWSAMFINNSTMEHDLTFKMPDKSDKVKNAVLTDEEHDWKSVLPLPVTQEGNTFRFQLPAQSLYTFQFSED